MFLGTLFSSTRPQQREFLSSGRDQPAQSTVFGGFLEELKEQASRITYSFGPYHLDPAERRFFLDGQDLRLPPKVFETLVYLVEHRGMLVEKDDLMKALWPEMFVEEVTLARNISLLRKALGDTPVQDQSQYIETVSKRGYRFVAEVKKVNLLASSSQKLIKSHRNRRAWMSLFGLILLLGAEGAYWRFHVSPSLVPPIRSIAVLPLENLSADPDQEYFADGMTDELITDLAQIHSLRVISRTSVMQFKHPKKTLPEIAAALNVDAIVEGSVSRSGTTVRITAQLLDARQDRHLWAASYERQIGDLLNLQMLVAKTIADQVKANLTPEEDARLSKRPPDNPAAVDALLRGRFLLSIRNRDTERLKKAVAYFQQAATIDPTNAEAWARLGDSYASLEEFGTADPIVTTPKARAAIQKALELNPDFAEAYIASGWLKMFDWDEAGAERDFERAIELSPNNSETHRRYAFYLRERGRYDEAVEENKRAMELAPLDIMPQIHLAYIYECAGLADKEIEQLNRVLELDPNYTTAHLRLGNAYALKGRWSEAIAAYEKVKETPDKIGYLTGIAWIWAASGNKHQAERAMAELKEVSRNSYVSPLIFAAYEARFGNRDEAFSLLEKAYQTHQPRLINLNRDHDFDRLRSDPRFLDLLRRIGQ
jgi:TolB-like protein/DNA-binding winged helix-turn-helix (wHTH) protein/Flp pilus assembly protein TadD